MKNYCMFHVVTASKAAPGSQLSMRAVLWIIPLLMSMSLIPWTASAQSGTTSDPYKSEILGWNISVSGPNYVLEDIALEEYPHGRGERIYISSVESLGFVEVSLFDDGDSPEQTIEIMLRDFESASESFVLLESGDQDGVFYAIARFDIDQSITGYFYIEVAEDVDGNVDFAQSIYSLNADFLEQISLARAEINLNGLAFLSAPVINLEAVVAADEAALASTPEAMATPQNGEYRFASGPASLTVESPISYDFPLNNNDLDVKFLKSQNGFGVVGYITQESESAETVIGSVFVGAPTDATAPQELYLDHDADHALGVYRIEADGETRVMVIEIYRVDESLWTVQAMSATESEFASDFEDYQQGVAVDSTPFLNDIELEDILTILD